MITNILSGTRHITLMSRLLNEKVMMTKMKKKKRTMTRTMTRRKKQKKKIHADINGNKRRD